MRFPRRRFLGLALGAAALPSVSQIASFIIGILSTLFVHDNAWSQARVVKLVVPYPPITNYGDSALNCGPSFTSACVDGFDLRTRRSMRHSRTTGHEFVQRRTVARHGR